MARQFANVCVLGAVVSNPPPLSASAADGMKGAGTGNPSPAPWLAVPCSLRPESVTRPAVVATAPESGPQAKGMRSGPDWDAMTAGIDRACNPPKSSQAKDVRCVCARMCCGHGAHCVWLRAAVRNLSYVERIKASTAEKADLAITGQEWDAGSTGRLSSWKAMPSGAHRRATTARAVAAG
jgi:hypothetical protein